MVNLKASADDAEALKTNTSVNIRKGLYSYYLPSHIGRKSSTVTSSILTSNNVNILMNLDVIDVISDTYYDSTKTFKSMLAATQNVMTFDGNFLNSKDEPITYRVSVLEITENKIMLTLEGGYFMFVAITPLALSTEILADMIQIARTSTVDSEAVLLSYSARESIDYKKETLDMFNQIAPESGTILDMISGGDSVEIP
ncbi:MAG: Uncharacterized protein FD133_1587 [Erysipelotrichaceae bacterium]|nr:MAG: hypothetical protein FD179_889 [Erysipelotrichaceae bacterium]TXT16994.1 MAG: Uncharacterized protein FD133_1587 [Erysipelotrichaceae bacterium]